MSESVLVRVILYVFDEENKSENYPKNLSVSGTLNVAKVGN